MTRTPGLASPCGLSSVRNAWRSDTAAQRRAAPAEAADKSNEKRVTSTHRRRGLHTTTTVQPPPNTTRQTSSCYTTSRPWGRQDGALEWFLPPRCLNRSDEENGLTSCARAYAMHDDGCWPPSAIRHQAISPSSLLPASQRRTLPQSALFLLSTAPWG